eukprot:TRINITY_DN3677_c0_g2_i1.p1 TRINITY_DN3677_c0_g2~~TRINITY_DN3677_c0_g2_i1.p1  ORF type:complete len:181 (-),score=31.52 TRINITY_DN3677_c0_g2_i1:195-674(-)
MVAEVFCSADVWDAMNLGALGLSHAAVVTAFDSAEDQLHPCGHHDTSTTQVIEAMPSVVDKTHGLDLDHAKMLYDKARLEEGISDGLAASGWTPFIVTPTSEHAVEQSDSGVPAPVGDDDTEAPSSPTDVDIGDEMDFARLNQVFWFVRKFAMENFVCN